MSKYEEDKKRMDKIAERIAYRQPLKEWACIYWIAVAIGHILEWIVKHGTDGIGADNSIADADKGE